MVFFTIYLTLHFLLSFKYRIFLIILGSAIFYAYWDPIYVLIPLLLTIIAWIGGIWVSRETQIKQRHKVGLTIIIMLAPLAYFKYSSFINTQIFGVDHKSILSYNGMLPIGLSFITFTTIAYIVEVKRKTFPVERSFFNLLQYVLFFPQLIAGPILRPGELLTQLKHPKRRNADEIKLGSTVFIIGLIKKVFFADQIARIIDPVWKSPINASFFELMGAIYGFSIQIYMDFSAYTDMAIGIAIILGVYLPINFNSPYVAGSIISFWHRWHITLSNWLRDFIYIPLGGNKKGKLNQYFNILITMFLGGLWHGAGWGFILWGGLHGLFLSINHFIRHFNLIPNVPSFFKVFIVFHLVTFTWVFFRADSVGDAFFIFRKLFSYFTDAEFIYQFEFDLVYLSLLLIPLIIHPLDNLIFIKKIVSMANTTILSTLLVTSLVFCMIVAYSNTAAFIYFDF